MIARPLPSPPTPAPSAPLRAGANVRIGRNALGFWMQGPGGGEGFSHPFTVTLSGSGARVSRGLILANIAVEPLIGKTPVSGGAGKPQPVLQLDSSLVNANGESWVCVQVKPDEEGKLDVDNKKSRVEVMQAAHPISAGGDSGRAPLAMVVYKGGRPQVFQIAMFHLRYETATQTNGPRKHFFL